MTNNQYLPVPPLLPGDENPRPGEIREGDQVELDPDANEDLVDSAEADRLATEPDRDLDEV